MAIKFLSGKIRTTLQDTGSLYSNDLFAGAIDAISKDGRIDARFSAAEKARRIDFEGAGAGPSSMIWPSGGGVMLVDHGAKLHLAIEEAPSLEIAPPTRLTWRKDVREDGFLFTIDIEDGIFGGAVVEMTVSTEDRLRPFGSQLLRLLICGPRCHQASGFPWDEIAEAGCVTAMRGFRAGSKTPVMTMTASELEVEEGDESRFAAPAEYGAFKPGVIKREPEPQPEPLALKAGDGEPRFDRVLNFGQNRQSLEEDTVATPDCFSSTRLGTLAATLHQDVLTHAATLINDVAPLLGAATISPVAGGTADMREAVLPWLDNLRRLNTGSAGAPGAGLAESLWSRPPPAPAPRERLGLMDRLAWRNLSEASGPDQSTITRRAYADPAERARLVQRWMLSPADDAALAAAAGDITRIPADAQGRIADAYALADLGTLRVPVMSRPFSLDAAGLARFKIDNIGGTIDFASLGAGAGGRPLVSAAIGAGGSIDVALNLPTIVITADLTRRLRAAGTALLVGVSVVACLFGPVVCGAAVAIAAGTAAALTNTTPITVNVTGTSVMLNVLYGYDGARRCVAPRVSVTGSSGSVRVVNTWRTVNVLGNTVDAIITLVGNLFDLWRPQMAELLAAAVQGGLIGAGVTLPVVGRQNNLRAVDGAASSRPGELLELRARVVPVSQSAAQPFATQVPRPEDVARELAASHERMRLELNQTPGGDLGVIERAVYLGLGVSQNVLNQYVFSQWLDGAFVAETMDRAKLRNLIRSLPGSAAGFEPQIVRMWSAAPPRVEVAIPAMAQGGRPAMVVFDDLRVCMRRLGTATQDGETPGDVVEFSFTLAVPATVQLRPPFVVDVAIGDDAANSLLVLNPTWDLTAGSDPQILAGSPPGGLDGLARTAADIFVSEIGRRLPKPITGRTQSPSPRAWNRRLVACQELILDASVGGIAYVDIQARRRTLYPLLAATTPLLELVNGSPTQPWLKGLVGRPGTGQLSLSNLTLGEGRTLGRLLNVTGWDPGPTAP